MKSIPLRQLLREPAKVKRITRSGGSVLITDNGNPLWIVQPATPRPGNLERAKAIDAVLSDALREPVSTVSLSSLVKAGRR